MNDQHVFLPQLPSRSTLLQIIGGAFFVALLIYGHSLQNDFVLWDDSLLIYQNPTIQGLTFHNIKRAFTTYDPELYIPLTLLSYQIDYVFGGLNPFIYHFTNLLLHTINALLVAWTAFLLSRGKRWAALGCGLLFLLHPLHTEAVAWASSRKDTLSTAFFFASLIGYLYGEERSSKKLRALSIVFFALGLMAKVNVIMLPIVLFLCDVLTRRPCSWKTIFQKSPYFLLALLFGIVALYGKREIVEHTTALSYILMAGKSTLFYLQKLFLPAGLSVLYPYLDPITIRSPDFWIPPLILAPLFLCALLALRWNRIIPFGTAFFLVTLLPTFTNFAKGGTTYFASDRYAYIPSFGIFFIIACGVVWIWEHCHRQQKTVTVIFAIILCLFAFLTYRQSMTWRDTEALFNQTLSLYPRSHVAHNNIGKLYAQQGRLAEAMLKYRAALDLLPSAETHYNIGLIHTQQGNIDGAIIAYRKAIALKPSQPQPHLNLGGLYAKTHRTNEAIAEFQSAAAADPSFAMPHYNLGLLYEEQGDLKEAFEEYKKTIDRDPYYLDAYINMANILIGQEYFTQALFLLQKTLEMDPGNPQAEELVREVARRVRQ